MCSCTVDRITAYSPLISNPRYVIGLPLRLTRSLMRGHVFRLICPYCVFLNVLDPPCLNDRRTHSTSIIRNEIKRYFRSEQCDNNVSL